MRKISKWCLLGLISIASAVWAQSNSSTEVTEKAIAALEQEAGGAAFASAANGCSIRSMVFVPARSWKPTSVTWRIPIGRLGRQRERLRDLCPQIHR
jgi:hypothetical protein